MLRRLGVQMERPYEVTCIRYYCSIFPRYKDDIFVRQKSLHMCTERDQNQLQNSVERKNLIEIETKNPDLSNSRLVNLNIRSLKKHLDITKSLIYQHKIDIFSLTETWLRDEDMYTINEACPPGYSAIQENRKEQRGGGIAVICTDVFKPKRIQTSTFSSFENLVVRTNIWIAVTPFSDNLSTTI